MRILEFSSSKWATQLARDSRSSHAPRGVEQLRSSGIIMAIAKQMGYEMDHADSSEVMAEINKVTPSYGGITYARIEKEGLIRPRPTEDHPGTPVLHRNAFAKGKGTFFSIETHKSAELPDGEYPFVLTTGRVHQHYHTGTMSRKGSALNRLYPEALAEVNIQDAKALNVADGDCVNIVSRRGSVRVKAFVSDVTDRGVAFMPFHSYEAAVNKLTSPAHDPISRIPEYKIRAVKIEKATA